MVRRAHRDGPPAHSHARATLQTARPGGRLADDASILQFVKAVDSHLGLRSHIDCASTDANIPLSLLVGGSIGFLSGLIGIGGGILLSPVLLLLKWTDQKQTAAISALFIFVNSLAGLAGQLTRGIQFTTDMYTYVVIAFVGGWCGAYFGALKFRQTILKNVLATVLLLAVYKLLFTAA